MSGCDGGLPVLVPWGVQQYATGTHRPCLISRLPVWSRHVGDPILKSDITRRIDFALFMLAALDDDTLIHEAPAIVGRGTPSALALAHASSVPA